MTTTGSSSHGVRSNCSNVPNPSWLDGKGIDERIWGDLYRLYHELEEGVPVEQQSAFTNKSLEVLKHLTETYPFIHHVQVYIHMVVFQKLSTNTTTTNKPFNITLFTQERGPHHRDPIPSNTTEELLHRSFLQKKKKINKTLPKKTTHSETLPPRKPPCLHQPSQKEAKTTVKFTSIQVLVVCEECENRRE